MVVPGGPFVAAVSLADIPFIRQVVTAAPEIWSASGVKMLLHCLECSAIDVLEGSVRAAWPLGRTTSSVVEEDVANNNAEFRARGDVRSVVQYHAWALCRLLQKPSFRRWPFHLEDHIDV